MQRPLFSLVNLSLTLVSPELGSKWWEAATVQLSDAPPMKGGSGDGRLQVGPGRASATQGGRSNGASESAAGFSGGCNPPPGQLEKPFVLLDEL